MGVPAGILSSLTLNMTGRAKVHVTGHRLQVTKNKNEIEKIKITRTEKFYFFSKIPCHFFYCPYFVHWGLWHGNKRINKINILFLKYRKVTRDLPRTQPFLGTMWSRTDHVTTSLRGVGSVLS